MTTLFSHVTAVTMDGPVLRDAFVSVSDGKIAAVDTAPLPGTFDRVIDARDKVLLPGLVNAHTHIPMTLMRGYAGGHDLQTWLNDYIFPAEDRLDGRAVRAGASLALAELIASGVTAIGDMYYFCDDIAQAVAQSGINANLCRCVTCFAPQERPEDFLSCREMREFHDKWHGYGGGQILVDVSLHAEYTSYACPEMWRYLGAYAAENGLGMQVHISETRSEHQDCLSRHGKTPLQILNDYGLWDCGRSLAAHCVWVTEEDRALMAEKGITAVHNPVSNLKLGSGIADVPALLRSGVNVALGTDGVSSNNSHDLWEELKLAATLHSGVTHDPMAVAPLTALEMATVNGARALGRKAGRIRPGYDADLILVDFSHPNLIPCHDVVENLVFSARGGDVCMNMCRGQIIYENGRFLTLDLDRIRSEVEQYAISLLFH